MYVRRQKIHKNFKILIVKYNNIPIMKYSILYVPKFENSFYIEHTIFQ